MNVTQVQEDKPVHPIIRQIIDRDCHVAESNLTVIRHVVSKLKHGYVTFKAMPKGDRREFILQCIRHHRQNLKIYVEVMSGFSKTVGAVKVDEVVTTLSGKQVVQLMRKHKKTIESLAFRLGTSQKRVREAREAGLSDPLAVRDWMEAITGDDPGPLPERYRINHITEESNCNNCGYPMGVGDEAYGYVGDIFCSISC
ncbi:MAG TPA: hypothetical protein PKA76_18920, partial [Pirellulaceae bacterium]|nr:hypothetical protein [Pirellulaceae bacterium]